MYEVIDTDIGCLFPGPQNQLRGVCLQNQKKVEVIIISLEVNGFYQHNLNDAPGVLPEKFGIDKSLPCLRPNSAIFLLYL